MWSGVVRPLGGGGVSVNVTTDAGQSVSVAGQPAQTGTFTATANVTTGQEFTIVETNGEHDDWDLVHALSAEPISLVSLRL